MCVCSREGVWAGREDRGGGGERKGVKITFLMQQTFSELENLIIISPHTHTHTHLLIAPILLDKRLSLAG